MQDINQNQQSDYMDAMKDIRETTKYREQMDMKREQNSNQNTINKQKLELEREKLQTQKDIANKNLEIARENKNKYDVKSNKKKDK